MRRTLLLVLALLAALSLRPDCVYACSCAQPETPLDAMRQAEVVFSGRLVDMPADMELEQRRPITFEAQHFWKGQPRAQVVLNTVRNAISCEGYFWEQGQEYLVYAYRQEDGTLGVHLCSRTVELAQAEADIVQLGRGIDLRAGEAPAPEEPRQAPQTASSAAGWLPIAGALAALLLMGVLAGVGLARRGSPRRHND